MTDPTMTIDGEPATAAGSFTVLNPATEEPAGEAPDCSAEQLDAAVAAAEGAFASWRTGLEARRAGLEAAAAALRENVDELAALLTAEQGKPLSEASVEVRGSARWLRYFARLELPSEVIQDDERGYAEVVRRPVGPTAAITPWNFPLSLMCWKVGPALLAGCTVVVKPSPYTPLTTLRVGELLREALPPGVVNVLSGGDRLGAQLTAHPAIRKVAFTGSVATGKLVARAAADDLKRVTLELGGNDAAIVLDDADPGAVARDLFWGAFQNCGQVCSAIKRLYVPDAIHDELVEALAERAGSVTVGDGSEEGTEVGPLNNAPQRDRVAALVSDAVERGGQVASGGAPLERSGFFFAPTVLAGAEPGMSLVDEEQFGPALPVIRYRELDDALEQANATNYGLGGSVWGADPDRAREVAGKLECGTAWINSHMVLAPHQPFGGIKWSGLGVENGPWGVYAFTDIQVRWEPSRNSASNPG